MTRRPNMAEATRNKTRGTKRSLIFSRRAEAKRKFKEKKDGFVAYEEGGRASLRNLANVPV
jgi:hypothetical protein